MTRGALAFGRLQRVIIGVFLAWVAIHTVIIWQTGWSAWRLGAMGMYADTSNAYRASAVVACSEPGCRREIRDVQAFAPLKNDSIPVLRSTPGGRTPYQLVDSRPMRGQVSKAFGAFSRFPASWNARPLVRERLESPCGPYLVILYKQRVSTLRREAWVSARPFVVSLASSGGCDEDERVSVSR